jgi:hypothetical protein
MAPEPWEYMILYWPTAEGLEYRPEAGVAEMENERRRGHEQAASVLPALANQAERRASRSARSALKRP